MNYGVTTQKIVDGRICHSQGCQFGFLKAKFLKFGFFQSGWLADFPVWLFPYFLALFWLFHEKLVSDKFCSQNTHLSVPMRKNSSLEQGK